MTPSILGGTPISEMQIREKNVSEYMKYGWFLFQINFCMKRVW